MSYHTNNTGRNNGRRRFLRRQGGKSRSCGFTLLELMIVITVMMILVAIAVPAYNQHIIQARESVLRSNLRELDQLIQQYTMDKGQAPQSLDDLKTAGYLREIPKDPMTGAIDWDTESEDPTQAADPQQPGIIAVHSHSTGMALDGTPYSSWPN
jgi:general secretion pathway protein G